MLDNLVCHDQNSEKSSHLRNRIQLLTLDYLISTDTEKYETALLLLDMIYAYYPGILPQLYIEAIKSHESTKQAQQIYHAFANRLYNGPAQAIKLLFENNLASLATSFLQRLEFIPEKCEATSAQELYDKFDIGHWDPNNQELTEELEILRQFIPNDRPTLDIACGQGRHLVPLASTHTHIFGTDINYHNIQKLKNNHPHTNVAVASWYHIPFKDQSFESIICLGRSAPHITTSSQWCVFLSEAKRVANELFIDIPDPQQGFAKEQIDLFDQTSMQHDALSSQSGIHIGTPNHQHFTPRFVPNDEYIRAIAQLNGWVANKVHQIEYTDQTGQKNTNNYWHFTKSSTTLTFDEYAKVANIVFPIQNDIKPIWISLD